jgi:hypothetical protein
MNNKRKMKKKRKKKSRRQGSLNWGRGRKAERPFQVLGT